MVISSFHQLDLTPTIKNPHVYIQLLEYRPVNTGLLEFQFGGENYTGYKKSC